MQDGGVRLQTDIRKDRGRFHIGLGTIAGRVARAQARHRGLAENLLHDRTKAKFDFRMSGDAVAVTRLARQRGLTLENNDLRSELGQRQSLLHGRVAAADDGDNPAAKQRAVAGRTMAHAHAGQTLLSGNTELLQRRPRCENDSACQDIALCGRHTPLSVLRIHAFEAVHHELSPGRDGLILHHRTQVVTRNAVREAGEALDLFDADKLAAEDVSRKDERASPQACRRHARTHAGDAASCDHHIEFFCQILNSGFTRQPGWPITLRP